MLGTHAVPHPLPPDLHPGWRCSTRRACCPLRSSLSGRATSLSASGRSTDRRQGPASGEETLALQSKYDTWGLGGSTFVQPYHITSYIARFRMSRFRVQAKRRSRKPPVPCCLPGQNLARGNCPELCSRAQAWPSSSPSRPTACECRAGEAHWGSARQLSSCHSSGRWPTCRARLLVHVRCHELNPACS